MSDVIAAFKKALAPSPPQAYEAPSKVDILDAIAGSLREHHPGFMTDFAANHLDAIQDHIVLMEEVRAAAQILVTHARSCHPGDDLECPYMAALDEALKKTGRAA